MANQYTKIVSANQVAEAGADLAVNEWINYINNLHKPSNCPSGKLDSQININAYKDQLEASKTNLLNDDFMSDSNMNISYSYSTTNLNRSEDLVIDIVGDYGNEEYQFQVILRYSEYGDVRVYKGSF